MKKNMSGFTLIEMTVVLFVIGIILSTILTILPSMINTSKIKKTNTLLMQYNYALLGYAMINFRLPYADSDNDGYENNNVYSGTLPFKTLGLAAGKDGWNHQIKYAVYGKSGGGNKNLTYSFATMNDFQTALNNASLTTDTTIVHTIDVNGNCNDVTPNQAYVIASGGAKDLDGSNGIFDLCNGNSNPVFNADNQIPTNQYDDLVYSKAITVFKTEINN